MTSLSLATWNLLHGQAVAEPGDARGIEQRLADGARRLDADVIAVQEVDCTSERSGHTCQVDIIAQAVSGQGRFCATLQGVPGQEWTEGRGHHDESTGPRYGIGLVTRLPVTRWESVALPASTRRLPLLVPTPSGPRAIWVRDEPRWALAAVISGPAGEFTAVCTHLSFVPGVNIRQLRALTQWCRGLPGPHYLLADLNLPRLLASRMRPWRLLASTATYPVGRPRVQFDHIAAGPGAPAHVLATEALALPAGDHRALRVELRAN
ncbi:MAG: endonuclease/exonuclease/phosphatase family protein [Actinomycetales bacterium]|nr:endonuclease/exonuclease/phosphatase family protein [Actinomycetales bacterium]